MKAPKHIPVHTSSPLSVRTRHMLCAYPRNLPDSACLCGCRLSHASCFLWTGSTFVGNSTRWKPSQGLVPAEGYMAREAHVLGIGHHGTLAMVKGSVRSRSWYICGCIGRYNHMNNHLGVGADFSGAQLFVLPKKAV